MTRNRFKIIGGIVCLIVANFVQISNAADKYAPSEWVNFDFNGYSTWDNGNCQLLWFTERRLELRPDKSSGISSQYVNRLHGRYTKNTGNKCKFKGEDSSNGLYANTRIWRATANQLSESVFSLSMSDAECIDSGCGDPEVYGSVDDFEAKLYLISNSEASYTSTSSFKARMLRGYAQDEFAAEAVEGFIQILGHIKAGNNKALRERYLSSRWFKKIGSAPSIDIDAERETLIRSFALVRPRIAHVTSQEVIESRYMSGFYFGENDYVTGDFAYVSLKSSFDDGSKGMVMAVLHKEQDVWRILSLLFW